MGQPAKRQAVTNPDNTIFGVKRLIGRRNDDADLAKDKKEPPLRRDRRRQWRRMGRSQEREVFSPSQISAFILGKMKETAEILSG